LWFRAAEGSDTFFPFIANGLKNVEVFSRDAMVDKNAVNLHRAGGAVGRPQRKLLRAFGDLELPFPAAIGNGREAA